MSKLGTLGIFAVLVSACTNTHKGAVVAPTPVERAYHPASRSSEITIAVEGSRISINGIAVGLEPTVRDFEAIFGKADRTSEKLNRIHTWDRLGVLVYEPYDGRAKSLTLYFQPVRHEFGAVNAFEGSLVVDGVAIDRDAYFDEVTWLGKRGSFGTNVTSDRGSFHVYASAPSVDAPLELASLSFYNTDQLDKPAPEGMRRAEQACSAGVATSCTTLALIHGTNRDAQSIARAFEYARRGCEGGDSVGCNTLGLMYRNGVGVARSPALATRAFARACSLGDRLGCSLARGE